ncbi:restriction endonuclease [Neobacillus sp. SAB-20_R2A]|uniref:restriction endonuclease n=1 Tax=Neobacillus sp. SAB-20_R2A TaxID=3120519 RepID=UPI003C6E3AAE
MRTSIGKVNCNFKDCELVLQDYTVELYVEHGTDFEFNLDENAEYSIKMDYDDYMPSIYVVKSHTNETVITLSAFYDDRAGRGVHLPFDKENILKKVNTHINTLNGYYKKRLDDYKRETDRKRNMFREEIIKKVNDCKTDSMVRTIIYNFITLNQPMLILEQDEYFQKFELMICENFSIGKYLLQIHEIYGDNWWLLKRLEVGDQQDKMTEYYYIFEKLVQIIKKREILISDDEAFYYTWILFNEEVCHYYFNQFNDQYGSYFSNVEVLSLQECIEIYSTIEMLDMKSIENECMFTYYLMYLKKFDEGRNYLTCRNIVVKKISEKIQEKEMDDFEALLLKTPKSKKIVMDDVDLMSGHEFESFVSELFCKMGYNATVTKGSGDQGIDVLAEKNNVKYGIQTKCYSGSVSNKAIQEVVAGLSYYKLHKGIVVTNSYFTESARELARSNNIILWDRSMLKEKISEWF